MSEPILRFLHVSAGGPVNHRSGGVAQQMQSVRPLHGERDAQPLQHSLQSFPEQSRIHRTSGAGREHIVGGFRVGRHRLVIQQALTELGYHGPGTHRAWSLRRYFPPPINGAAHVELTAGEVHVLPLESQSLAAPDTCRQKQHVERLDLYWHGGQQPHDLLLRQGRLLDSHQRGRQPLLHWTPCDQLQIEGAREHGREDRVQVAASPATQAFGFHLDVGKRAFDGKSTASVVAKIMGAEPVPLSRVAPLTPPALEWAVRRCLNKDPEERWQSAGDLAGELRWILEGGSRAGVAVPAAVRTRRGLLRWSALVLALGGSVVLGFLLKRAPLQPVMRVGVNLPPVNTLVPGNAAVLSPDGKQIVMNLADAQGRPKLWVRSLAIDGAQSLEGTEGGILPFWSPDSRFIAFFAVDGKLRKIPGGGGPSEAVCDVWQTYGGTWGRNGIIVFATGRRGLFQVPASGGTPVRIPISEKDAADYRRPSFLPDGKHLLVTSNAASGGIFVVSLDTGAVQSVLSNESSPASYVEPGYLLYLHGDGLIAQPFDLRNLRVAGTGQRIAESVFTGDMSFSAAAGGLLLYQRAFHTQLTWFDPDGNKLSTVGSPGYISAPYISPDGKYAIASVTDPRQGRLKLWLYDLNRGTESPFTFGDGSEQYPAWSPDSKQVAFSSTRAGQEDIYVKPVGGGSQERPLLTDPGDKEPDRWSSDGRYILFDYVGKSTHGTDVWAAPLFGDHKPFAVAQGPGNDNWGVFSPDGKWVAYSSDESGRAEIYVVPFPGPGGKWQISTAGGIVSYWPANNELYYFTPDTHVMAVELEFQGTNLVVGKSRQLFGGRAFGNAGGLFPVPDRKRWLVAFPVDEANASPLILTTNWTAALAH